MTDDTQDQAQLELPFDQYQRYRVAADLIAMLDESPSGPIIDVGGGPGFVEQFVPGRDSVVVDLEGSHPGRFAIADGARLPFPDRTFSVGLALDALEHVPPVHRDAFLAELRRTSDLVIVSAPFAGELVELAEGALNEFITARFGNFPTLNEHAEHGLPVLEPTVKSFDAEGWGVAVLPSGYLPRWLIGMLVHHELLASGLPELHHLHAFYNKTVSPFDCREPAYRHVIIATRDGSSDRVEAAATSLQSGNLDPAADVGLHGIATMLYEQRIGSVVRSAQTASLRGEKTALETQLAVERDRIADLEREVADRDAHIVELRRTLEVLASERRPLKQRGADAMHTAARKVKNWKSKQR